MKRKIEDLYSWEWILCNTEEEAKAICRLMNEKDIKRRSNIRVQENDTKRDENIGNWITFFPIHGTYWIDNYTKKRKYDIYLASDFF